MSITRIIESAYSNCYNKMRCFVIKRNHIEEFQRKTKSEVLTEDQKREVASYYHKYHKCSTVFHKFYTEKTGEFHTEYLPDDLYYGYIDPYFNPIPKAKVMDNKCLYGSLFHGIKQPEIIARRMNGMWITDRLISEADLYELVRQEPEFFIKVATESFGGHGVKYLSSDSGRIAEAVKEFLRDKNKADIVIQKPLKQHRDLSKINSSSVNTIRILSLLSADGG